MAAKCFLCSTDAQPNHVSVCDNSQTRTLSMDMDDGSDTLIESVIISSHFFNLEHAMAPLGHCGHFQGLLRCDNGRQNQYKNTSKCYSNVFCTFINHVHINVADCVFGILILSRL